MPKARHDAAGRDRSTGEDADEEDWSPCTFDCSDAMVASSVVWFDDSADFGGAGNEVLAPESVVVGGVDNVAVNTGYFEGIFGGDHDQATYYASTDFGGKGDMNSNEDAAMLGGLDDTLAATDGPTNQTDGYADVLVGGKNESLTSDIEYLSKFTSDAARNP